MCEKFLEEERWTDRTNENIDVALSSELTGYSDIHDNSPSEKMEEAQIVEANSGSSSGSGPSNPSPLVCNVVSTSSSTPGERISTLPQQRERVHGVLPSYIQAEFGLSVKADRFYRNQDTRRMFGFYTTPAASTAATRTTAKHPKVVHADQPYVGWTREVLVDNEGGTAVQFLAPPPPQRENHFSSSSDTSTVQHDNEDREVISTPEDLSHFTRRQVVSSSAHAPPTNCSTLLVTSFEFDELFCLCHRPEEGDYFHCDYGLAGCGSWFHSGCVGVSKSALSRLVPGKDTPLLCPLCTAYLETSPEDDMQFSVSETGHNRIIYRLRMGGYYYVTDGPLSNYSGGDSAGAADTNTDMDTDSDIRATRSCSSTLTIEMIPKSSGRDVPFFRNIGGLEFKQRRVPPKHWGLSRLRVLTTFRSRSKAGISSSSGDGSGHITAGDGVEAKVETETEAGGGVDEQKWVANCSKCGVVGPYRPVKKGVCVRQELHLVPRETGEQGEKCSNFCGHFRVNPRRYLPSTSFRGRGEGCGDVSGGWGKNFPHQGVKRSGSQERGERAKKVSRKASCSYMNSLSSGSAPRSHSFSAFALTEQRSVAPTPSPHQLEAAVMPLKADSGRHMSCLTQLNRVDMFERRQDHPPQARDPSDTLIGRVSDLPRVSGVLTPEFPLQSQFGATCSPKLLPLMLPPVSTLISALEHQYVTGPAMSAPMINVIDDTALVSPVGAANGGFGANGEYAGVQARKSFTLHGSAAADCNLVTVKGHAVRCDSDRCVREVKVETVTPELMCHSSPTLPESKVVVCLEDEGSDPNTTALALMTSEENINKSNELHMLGKISTSSMEENTSPHAEPFSDGHSGQSIFVSSVHRSIIDLSTATDSDSDDSNHLTASADGLFPPPPAEASLRKRNPKPVVSAEPAGDTLKKRLVESEQMKLKALCQNVEGDERGSEVFFLHLPLEDGGVRSSGYSVNPVRRSSSSLQSHLEEKDLCAYCFDPIPSAKRSTKVNLGEVRSSVHTTCAQYLSVNALNRFIQCQSQAEWLVAGKFYKYTAGDDPARCDFCDKGGGVLQLISFGGRSGTAGASTGSADSTGCATSDGKPLEASSDWVWLGHPVCVASLVQSKVLMMTRSHDHGKEVESSGVVDGGACMRQEALDISASGLAVFGSPGGGVCMLCGSGGGVVSTCGGRSGANCAVKAHFLCAKRAEWMIPGCTGPRLNDGDSSSDGESDWNDEDGDNDKRSGFVCPLHCVL